jgi:hypothetical protein
MNVALWLILFRGGTATGSVAVSGPYWLDERDVYVGGAAAVYVYRGGVAAMEVVTSGVAANEVKT